MKPRPLNCLGALLIDAFLAGISPNCLNLQERLIAFFGLVNEKDEDIVFVGDLLGCCFEHCCSCLMCVGDLCRARP